MLETADAVRNIDAICAVEGIDCAIVAQFDLSTTLGLPGQFNHPDFRAAVERIERAAFKANSPLGAGPARSRQEAEVLFARGYRMLANFDILRLKASVSETVGWTRGEQT